MVKKEDTNKKILKNEIEVLNIRGYHLTADTNNWILNDKYYFSSLSEALKSMVRDMTKAKLKRNKKPIDDVNTLIDIIEKNHKALMGKL